MRTTAAAAIGLFLLLTPAALAYWPVDILEIGLAGASPDETGNPFMRAPALLGRDMQSSIIHSVELTPVIDIYRVQEGRIRAWREKTMSHNAGLPSIKPERGRFVSEPPWMIMEGGGHSWESILYRVGTEELGRNELCVFARPCRELWREKPGARLLLRIVPGHL